METIKAWAKSIDKSDAQFIVSTLVTLTVWWFFFGRKKYSTKGMR